MRTGHVSIAIAALAVATAGSTQAFETPVVLAQMTAPAQKSQDLKGMEKAGQRDDIQPMTAAQQAQYKAEYEAAKAKWATLTPEQKSATIAAARKKKLSDSIGARAGGPARRHAARNDGADSVSTRPKPTAAKAKWDKLSPAEKRAVRRAAWAKERGDLSGVEAVGQRDDTYILPY